MKTWSISALKMLYMMVFSDFWGVNPNSMIRMIRIFAAFVLSILRPSDTPFAVAVTPDSQICRSCHDLAPLVGTFVGKLSIGCFCMEYTAF